MIDEEFIPPTSETAGAHYGIKTPIGEFEAIDIIEAVVSRKTLSQPVAYCVGNALKYILRVGNKPNASKWEDLAKAENYLHRARTGVWMNTKQKESK